MTMRSVALSVAAAFVLAALGCQSPVEPPGRHAADAPSSELPLPSFSAQAPDAEPVHADAYEPSSNNQLLSIAMETPIYQAPAYGATKIGYLRAGAKVDRAYLPTSHDGCEGGFYRIAPRGYVCVGKTATLDTSHPVAQASVRGPRRGEPYPYTYVISRSPPPHRYVRLPTLDEQRKVEGSRRDPGTSWALQNVRRLGPADELTTFFSAGVDTPKPFGAEERVRFDAHRGRAKGRSAFGIEANFAWTGRRFGLTTELDLIPIDRTDVVEPSTLRGVRVETENSIGFVMHHGVGAMRLDDDGKLKPAGVVERRSGWVLTGKTHGDDDRFLETEDGRFLPADTLRIATPSKDMWGYADEGRRWIDVSLERQILVAYEGTRPAYAALISSGRGGADPEEESATVQGTFFIEHKHVSATMDGDQASEAAFDLRDVPYVQYFHNNYALHGAYWHDEFGKARSSGCINLAPFDAAWLFEWTEPVVPDGWHAATNRKRGTLVYIHP